MPEATTPDQFEVFPSEDGTWNWCLRVNGDTVDGISDYELRSEALSAARDANGTEEVDLVRADGTSAGKHRIGQPDHRIVLLRLDGSLYGELDAGPPTPGTPQHFNLTPAAENGEAGIV